MFVFTRFFFKHAFTISYLGTKRKILVKSAPEKVTLVPADNSTDGFVAHTTRATMDFTRHMWVFAG